MLGHCVRNERTVMDHLIDDSDRLKPCPFCGGSASMVYVDRGHDAGGRYIACDACGHTWWVDGIDS